MVFASLLLINCSKSDFTPEPNSNSTSENNTLRGDSTESDTANATLLLDNTLTPITTGVSLVNGVLEFTDMATFKSVMTTLVNQPRSALDAWELSLGFTSLRKTNNDKESDDNIDDYDLDLLRIPDPAFESVLNSDKKVIIKDSLYEINLLLDETYVWYGGVLIRTIDNGSRGSDCPNQSTQTTGSRIFNSGNEKIYGSKWNKFWGFYSSVGMTSVHYELNSRNKFKKKKASAINVYIDQWYNVCHKTEASALFNCESNVRKTKLNAKRVTHIFLHDQGISFSIELCVSEFGRTQHWTTDFSLDYHDSPW